MASAEAATAVTAATMASAEAAAAATAAETATATIAAAAEAAAAVTVVIAAAAVAATVAACRATIAVAAATETAVATTAAIEGAVATAAAIVGAVATAAALEVARRAVATSAFVAIAFVVVTVVPVVVTVVPVVVTVVPVVAVSRTRYASRAAAVLATIVTTVPSAAHAEMAPTLHVTRPEVIAATLVVAASAIHAPAVTTSVGCIEVRTAEVEIVAAGITGIYPEVPVAAIPYQRTIEIGGCTEKVPLPAVEYVANVLVAALPVQAQHIVIVGDTHQVVEVDLIGCLILQVSKIELVGHLVGEEKSLVASLLVGHGACRHCHGQKGEQGDNHLFHNRIFLRVINSVCFVFCCKVTAFP